MAAFFPFKLMAIQIHIKCARSEKKNLFPSRINFGVPRKFQPLFRTFESADELSLLTFTETIWRNQALALDSGLLSICVGHCFHNAQDSPKLIAYLSANLIADLP